MTVRRCLPFAHRVLKWWRHKNEISEIMGFVRIFWKSNVQEAYLPKMSISGQIVSKIVARLYSENSIQTLLIVPFNISQGFPIIMDNIKNDVKWQKNTMHLSKLNFFRSLHRWNCCYQLNSHGTKDLSHNCIKLGKYHKRKMNRLIKKIQKLFIREQYKTIF